MLISTFIILLLVVCIGYFLVINSLTKSVSTSTQPKIEVEDLNFLLFNAPAVTSPPAAVVRRRPEIPLKSSEKALIYAPVPETPIVAQSSTQKEAPVSRTVIPQTASSVAAIGTKSNHTIKGPIPWSKFIKLPLVKNVISGQADSLAHLNLQQCSTTVVQDLTAPVLSEESFKWCQWALSPEGGNVKVGKSYGSLKKPDRSKYDNLNCNEVAKGKNPSCESAWGDLALESWINNKAGDLCGNEGDPSRASRVNCMDSPSEARFCTFENIMLDFSKMHLARRPGRSTDSRSWDKGFMATDCDKEKHPDINYYALYEPWIDPSSTQCDVHIDATVLAYGHDDIRNLGHTMSDFMNVWAMTWMAGDYSKDVIFLNVDAIRQGHNYNDEMKQFGKHYYNSFSQVLLARDYDGKKVCIKKLIFMPKPVILFTWDGWWEDMKCTFLGPSSLFQRWNLNIRKNYGLLSESFKGPSESAPQILILSRKAAAKSLEMYTRRVMKNEKALVAMLKTALPEAVIICRDLGELPFEEQVRLIASSSIVVGVHGAGIPATMHMSVGAKACCGVVEIFPVGEFMPIKGYGNMARRMGHHYERLELPGENCEESGATVPPEMLLYFVKEMLKKITTKPSCVLPAVVENPYYLN